MTARLTNAVGTRLGISHSWKLKNVINTKTQFSSQFKREQQYIQYMHSLFNSKSFKKQSILPGSCIKYYNNFNKLHLDFMLYDTAFERTRFNIKSLRRLTAFIKEHRNKFYKSPNLELLKLNRIKETNFFKESLKRQDAIASNTNISFAAHSLTEKSAQLLTIAKIRENIYNTRVISEVYSKKKKNVLAKFAKLLVYFFARHAFFKKHAIRVMQRVQQKQHVSFNHLNVNLISIPKVHLTITIIMNFIIKRLYLNYNLLETLKTFKKYLKLRTRGYILRGCGRLTKKQRAWYIKRHKGKTKINNLAEYVTYKYKPANLKYGTVGVKLWINY